ncbi:unnamed protein product [Adineta steineri]|uniref:G-protein coupled receptors family 1 profile domain-containing protein n=1 Tax=Adineta steineri TaxID=433720 RepID=A0A815AC12_9BILA|nr:unnamed protein product [Adineta steineri]CAF1253626.1 unnamed protein product [Adineta steineri]
MSNSTRTRTSFNDLVRTVNILQEMDPYVCLILYVIGTCGAVLNIITFLQKQLRIKPCGVYFLATSIVDLSTVNMFILIQCISTFNASLGDKILLSRIWCKFGNWLRFQSPCLASTYFALISFDRFCVSSLNPTLRNWSNLRISRRVVVISFLIWALLALHYPIAYDVRQDPSTMTNQCQVVLGSSTIFYIMDGLLFSLFNGAIIPFVLVLLSLLIFSNMNQSRNRVNPQQNTIGINKARSGTGTAANGTTAIHSRHNSHMLRMVLAQALFTIILQIPFAVIYVYTYGNPVLTSFSTIQIYYISAYIARWLYLANYCKTFYINTLTSQLFRNSLHQQCRDLYYRYQRM